MTAITVIIRFTGEPDDLLERFERARQRWTGEQGDDYQRPAFYAACRTEDGIAIVNGWHDDAAHRAFGQGLHAAMDAVGMGRPAEIERLRVETLGWD